MISRHDKAVTHPLAVTKRCSKAILYRTCSSRYSMLKLLTCGLLVNHPSSLLTLPATIPRLPSRPHQELRQEFLESLRIPAQLLDVDLDVGEPEPHAAQLAAQRLDVHLARLAVNLLLQRRNLVHQHPAARVRRVEPRRRGNRPAQRRQARDGKGVEARYRRRRCRLRPRRRVGRRSVRSRQRRHVRPAPGAHDARHDGEREPRRVNVVRVACKVLYSRDDAVKDALVVCRISIRLIRR
jgi:hypothetical protein